MSAWAAGFLWGFFGLLTLEVLIVVALFYSSQEERDHREARRRLNLKAQQARSELYRKAMEEELGRIAQEREAAG